MTPLYIILEMTEGAKRVSQTDPHGWILTLISVCVVFTALLILYGIYTLIGKAASNTEDAPVPSRKLIRAEKKRLQAAERQQLLTAGQGAPDEVAAAITMALQAELGSETEVAIATALALYLGSGVHDVEPGIITIKRATPSAWSNKALTFRKYPRK